MLAVPFRPQPRRNRHERSAPEPLSPVSPVDSGYGSASPWTPPEKDVPDITADRTSTDLLRHFDGTRSDSDDPYVDSDAKNIFVGVTAAVAEKLLTLRTRHHQRKRSASLPHQTPQSRSARLVPARSSPATRLQGRSKTTPLRHADRFIPNRHWDIDASERLRIHKAPHKLTPAERLVRSSQVTEDPFIYRWRVVTPLGQESRARPRPESAASRNEDGVGNVLGPLDQNSIDGIEQHSDPNGPWTTDLGGAAVNNGRGQLVRSGTNARLFRTTFPTARPRSEEELEKHKDRLAAALGIDMAQRVLDVTSPNTHHSPPSTKPGYVRTKWNGTEWVNDGPIPKPQKPIGNRTLPTAPFRVLDAPNLRDDFYCSTLAYSSTAKTLAVGLGHLIYGWSESRGVRLLNSGPDPDCYLTSLSFSSTEGCKAILAFGRSDGTLGLLSLYDDSDPASRIPPKPRFETPMPSAVACVSWKPVCTIRPSKSWEHPGLPVKNEDLLVGDETGLVYYYAVEWPERWEVERNNWSGDMTLLARISAHSQQICGLAWSRTADVFATGGNDNLCWLFEAAKVEPDQQPDDVQHQELQVPETSNPGGHAREPREASATETEIFKAPSHPPFKRLGSADARHRWPHGAAVKAIAFCPWQDSLVATGGGSNDKCIHFFHTGSGAALASISVSAQVTSLIWSTTRREIAATFGYAQPDHPVRIAVFSWPECRQVAAIPWAGEHRALYAIPYPGGPRGQQQTMTPGNHERRTQDGGSSSRTAKEGCIMVASSDKSVKFHEVWASDKKGTASTAGVLGGSPILEFLEGIDREGEVIR